MPKNNRSDSDQGIAAKGGSLEVVLRNHTGEIVHRDRRDVEDLDAARESLQSVKAPQGGEQEPAAS